MTTVAAIDCGTNSIKVLIASDSQVLLRDSRVVRLGEGVDETGMLAEGALERTFAAIDEFAEVIRSHGVPPELVRFCATSATRDAGNSAVFTEGVRRRLGVELEVLSGDEEAALVYAGATAGLGSGTGSARCRAGARRRHRRRVDGAGAGAGWSARVGLDGHRVGAAPRAAPALGSADGRRGRGVRRRHRPPPRRVRHPSRRGALRDRHLRHDQDRRLRRPRPGQLRPRRLRPRRAGQRRRPATSATGCSP